MLKDYNRVMNRVSASEGFKKELLAKLETAEKINRTNRIRYRFATVASAAMVMIIIAVSVALSPLVSTPTTLVVVPPGQLPHEFFVSTTITHVQDEESGISMYEVEDEVIHSVSGGITPEAVAQYCIINSEDNERIYVVGEIIHNTKNNE